MAGSPDCLPPEYRRTKLKEKCSNIVDTYKDSKQIPIDVSVFFNFVKYKKQIDVSLGNLEHFGDIYDEKLLLNLVNDFLLLLDCVYKISSWLEDVNKGRIATLHSHFMKLAFNNNSQNDSKFFDDKRNLKNDLDHFWSFCYMKPIENVKVSIQSFRSLLSDLHFPFNSSDHVLLTTGNKYPDCLKSLEMISKDLLSAADSIMRSKSLPKLIQSFETFVLKLADMSDEMMQISFCVNTGYLSTLQPDLVSSGEMIKKILRIERICYLPKKQNEVITEINSLLRMPPVLIQKELKDKMKDLMKNPTYEQIDVHNCLYQMRRAVQKQICGTAKVTVSAVVIVYMKECLSWIEFGEMFLNTWYDWFNEKNVNIRTVSDSLSARLDELIHRSRTIAIEQKLDSLPRVMKPYPSQVNIANLTSSAISCMHDHHLDHLSNCLQKLELDERNIDNLKDTLLPLVSLVINCAKESEEIRKLFNDLLKRYVDLVSHKSCDKDKSAFVSDVSNFVERMSTDLDVFLNEVQFEQDKSFYSNLAELFPNTSRYATLNLKRSIVLNFLINDDITSLAKLGVEINFLERSRQLRYNRVLATKNFHGGSRVIQCRFEIPMNCCNKLYYRYTISFVPEMLSTTRVYDLHEVNDCYRVLCLPSSRDVVTTYDSFIHPQVEKSKGIFRTYFVDPVLGNTSQEFEPPDMINQLHSTLTIYLDDVLSYLKNSNIHSVEDVTKIYSTIHNVVKYSEEARIVNMSRNLEGIVFYQETPSIIAWKLLADVTVLSKSNSKIPERVISAVIVCRYLYEFCLIKQRDVKQSLLKVISLFFVSITKDCRCLEYDVIKKIFYAESFKDGYHYMDGLWNLLRIYIGESGRKISSEILKALPLLNWFHPFGDVSVPPFSQLPASLVQLQLWYDKSVSDLNPLNSLPTSEIQTILQENHCLIEADILLQILLVRVCPNSKHHLLFESVLLPVILACLGIHLIEKKTKCKDLWDTLQKLFQQKEKLLSKYQELISEIVIFILEDGMKLHIDKNLENDIKVLKGVVYVSMQVYMYCNENKVEPLMSFIKWWAVKQFSKCIQHTPTDEHQFWTELYQLNAKNEAWCRALTHLIQSRYDKDALFSEKLRLMLCLENKDQSWLVSAISDKLEFDLDVQLKTKSGEQLTSQIVDCFEKSSTLRLILCKKVEDMFPQSTINFDSILTWDYWPIVITAIQSAHPDNVGTKCVSYLSDVSNLLTVNFASCLENEDLTVADVNKIRLRWDSHLVKVISALKLSQDIFIRPLTKCGQKIQLFELFLNLFDIFFSSNVIGHLKNVLSDTKKKFDRLKNDYEQKKIKELCQETENDCFVFPCFDEASHFLSILIPFAVLNSKYFDNDIFRQLWNEFLRKDIEINEIVPQIWDPVMEASKNILSALQHGDIQISEVRKRFGSKEKSDNINAIQKLVSAFSVINSLGWIKLSLSLQSNNGSIEKAIARNGNLQKHDWIDQIAGEINKWSSVDKLTDVADCVLKILKGLKIDLLEEEQETLELFSSMNIQYLEDKMIKDVNYDGLNEMKNILKRIKVIDKEVLVIIEQFCQQSDLRKWITEKSESLHEMEKFISIAIGAVAGEGHVVQDRLSDLRTLCSKFSVLLYNLPLNDEKVTIIEVVKCIHKCAERIPNSLIDSLNKLLQVCLTNLPWYMSQGELQGSVEKGAVKDLEDINHFGTYTIQLCQQSGSYAITLEVSSDDETVTCKNWELSELLELESKLVLITRETAEWFGSKKIFQDILQQVIRISDMVQRMKDYGHQKYLDIKMKILCPSYISELDYKQLVQKSEDLVTELCSWINRVWLCRKKYYHLNFYTNQQLVILKNEINAIEKNDHAVAGSQLFNLLYSVTGRFFKSTFAIRRILREDGSENNHFDDLDSGDEVFSEHQNSFVENSTATDSFAHNCSDNTTPLDIAIDELREEQKHIFTNLVEMAYEKELAYEAVIQEENTDIYEAIDWCDDKNADDEFIEKLCQKWQIGGYSEVLLIEDNCVSQFNFEEANHEYADFSEIGRVFAPFHYSSHTKMTTSVLSDSDYSLESLGQFLQKCAKIQDTSSVQIRDFPQCFEHGKPNLVVVNPEDVFLAVLRIYFEDREKSLPCYEEILLCSVETTLEEVGIFLMRAMYDPQQSNIYCLVHAEKLKYLVAEKAMDLIDMFSQGRSNYRLIVICSSEREQKSIPVSRLQTYRRKLLDINCKDIQEYTRYHLCNDAPSTWKNVFASDVDTNKYRVRLVSSESSGVGKTLYVRRMKEQLVKHLKKFELLGSQSQSTVEPVATVALHGPIVTVNEVLSLLLRSQDNLRSSIIHLDIPQKVIRFIDDILFSLIFLRGLSNTDGQIWRCLPTQYYLIETVIPNEKHYLNKFLETKRVMSILHLLPSVECIKPEETISKILKTNDVGIDKIEMCTPMYQRVYQYLEKINNREELESFKYAGTMRGTDKSCLEMIIKYCGVERPTWKEIRHFVWFLNVQLSACEQSNLLPKWKGLKTFVANFMINMSRDFATSSISNEDNSGGNTFDRHQVNKSWEQSMHPYLFFNKNRTSVTHVGMHVSISQTGNMCLKDNNRKEKIDVVTSPEILRFLEDVAKVPRKDIQTQTAKLIDGLAEFFNIKTDDIKSPDTGYVLTQDNLTKIMGIQMRFRCRIPVVLMGETGCGKTHLIRFMCQFARYNNPNIQNMFILKVHGGTTESEVIECIETAEKNALINRKQGIETVVFFDEANTSDIISLIKEIMCDGRCRGKPIPPFLKFIAACNPYRQHEEIMKQKLKSAGLGWKESEAIETLGEIPMRDLVYRVLEIPTSMRALVYDFGSLSVEIEKQYIYEIVKNRIYDCGIVNNIDVINHISNIFNFCQEIMRQSKDECSFVSLRDVERAAIVFNYFYQKFFNTFMIGNMTQANKLEYSFVLTISVCYHSRIENRESFEKLITNEMKRTKTFQQVNNVKEFKNIIYKSQMALLNCMKIHQNIALNAALRENVFMMVVCIELRIPLFLVGKPGSSKSLAKSIISNSMHGEESAKDNLTDFKKVNLCSHQCSRLSTPASIIEVFHKAKLEQENENVDKFASVVVLDEVGLAEASPHLPLKALHPLLEDGTEGSGKNSKNNEFLDKRYDRKERVAFIGISNWALDPAKMNRGIMVTRGDPGIHELIESARGICSSTGQHKDKNFQTLEKLFGPLSKAYYTISDKQKRPFFGLRDFYSLIKMLYWMVKTSDTKLSKAQLLHAIKRNFDGYGNHELDPVQEFHSVLKPFGCYDFNSVNGDVVSIKSLSGDFLTVCDGTLIWRDKCAKEAQFILGIDANSKRSSFQSLVRIDRYLGFDRQTSKLVLTDRKDYIEVSPNPIQEGKDFVSLNSELGIITFEEVKVFTIVNPVDSVTNPDCAPLGLIKASLETKDTSWHGESRYLLFLTENYSALQTLKQYIIATTDMTKSDGVFNEPFVLFGSNFPKDNEYSQVCRNISEVRLCMETGRMVILLNLENLYESLYDVLNQYYAEVGGHRYVDLGLRTNRMKCRVHEEFKLILIAEKTKVYEDFPIPLVNRMEKHFVSSHTVLNSLQIKLCKDLEKWIKEVTGSDKHRNFRVQDVFIGYNSDTVAAIVLQASSRATSLQSLDMQSPSADKVVSKISKYLLLQLATPDGICRYMSTIHDKNNQLDRLYFIEQEHSSLSNLFHRLGSNITGQLIQVTSHCQTLSHKDLSIFAKQLKYNDDDIVRSHLESFHTEQDFINSVRGAFEKGCSYDSQNILILECDSGHNNGNLISCCRYRIVDILNDEKLKNSMTCILFLIHLPRKYPKSNFVSFQEHPWNCYHVDELITDHKSMQLSDVALANYSVSEMFNSNVSSAGFSDSGSIISEVESAFLRLSNLKKRDMRYCERLYDLVPEAMSACSIRRDRIHILQSIIPQEPTCQDVLYQDIVDLMKKSLDSETHHHKDWVLEEASNMDRLEETGTFRRALTDKLKQIIIPALSNVLSFIDQHDNLDTLEHQTQAWHVLFRNCIHRQYFTNSSDRSTDKAITCKFPFSWVVYNIFEEITGNKEAFEKEKENMKPVLDQLPVDLLDLYLNDFVQLHYKFSSTDHIYKIILSVTWKVIQNSQCDSGSLFETIMKIHRIHSENVQYFEWFLRLVSQVPSILQETECYQDMNIKEVVSVAVDKTLSSAYFDLHEPFMKGKTALRGWIQKLYGMQSMIECILRFSPSNQTRLTWKWICVKRMFVEHIVLKNEEEMLFVMKRIEKKTERIEKLESENTLNVLVTYLTAIEKGLPKVKNVLNRKAIHESCWMLFKEALMLFCFDSNDPISSETAISDLIEAVFSATNEAPSKIKQFIQFHAGDETIALQIWVLKAICTYNKFCDAHLEKILSVVEGASQLNVNWIGYNDSIYVTTLSLYNFFKLQSGELQNILVTNGINDFEQHRAQPTSVACLKSIAQIHHSCQTLAEALDSLSLVDDDTSGIDYFSGMLSREVLNDDASSSGPFWYLLRLIVKKYGLTTLITASQSPQFAWITDHEIFENETEMWHYLDPAAIYNPIYEELRSSVSELLSGSSSALDPMTLHSRQAIPLVLAIYERVRQSHVCSMLPSKHIEKTDMLNEFVTRCQIFKPHPEIVELIKKIISNTHCGDLPELMVFSPEESHEDYITRTLVIHATTALMICKTNTVTKFFSDVLLRPKIFKTHCGSMPTMHSVGPYDVHCFLKYPECKKFHKHTTIMINHQCPLCGTKITEQTGPDPDYNNSKRSINITDNILCTDSTGLGFLFPVSYGIIRSILYCCLLWSSCHNRGIDKILKLSVDDLPLYFWNQLKANITCIHEGTGRSIDDSVMIIHMVIQEIVKFGEALSHEDGVVERIKSVTDHQQWELQFERLFIQPVLNNVAERMNQLFEKLTDRDHNRLFSSLYLFEKLPNCGKDAAHWQYHPNVTMKHFLFNNINLELENSHPALFFMITEIDSVEATKYISDIVLLLRNIHDIVMHNYSLSNKQQLDNMKFADFVVQHISESKVKSFQGKFDSLCHAWKMSRSSIYIQNHLKLNKEFKDIDLTENTRMACLIPTMQDDGLLTTALLDHLVWTHNCVVQRSRHYVKTTLEREWLIKAREVNIMKLDSSDYIDYKDRLFDFIIKRHSTYEFRSGNPYIKYDIVGLEKDLVCQCVLDKRIITGHADIPQVVWELSSTVLAMSIVEHKIPQKELSRQAAVDILSELKTIAQLTDVIKTIETALNFLKTEEPKKLDKKLKSYTEHLQLQLNSITAGQHCLLENINYLWKLLSIEKEKLHCRKNETPFRNTEEKYLVKISGKQADRLSESLRSVSNLEELIWPLYDFIKLMMKYHDPNKEFYEALAAFQEERKQQVTKYKDVLVKELKVKNAIDIWKHIILYQDKLKRQLYY